MTGDDKIPASYLRTLLLVLGLLIGLCFGLNLLVDPLWHFSGNRLTGQNMGFNERLSKLNRAARIVADKNCVIYGSSRGTLLDENFIDAYDCLNIAVSQGLAEEFPLIARFLKGHGLQAQLLIINADDLSFFSPPGAMTAPAFLRQGSQPAPWWQDALSLDVLQFSLRALAGKSPTPRYYQEDFSITIEQGRRRYSPQADDLVPLQTAASVEGRQVHPEFLDYYRQLIEQHPQAQVVIYIPPISLWRVSDMIRRGEFHDYLSSIHSLHQLGHPVMDFSVPSDITSDPERTYDGSHYNLDVNQVIAQNVLKGQCQHCLLVHELTEQDYRQQFERRYEESRLRLQLAGKAVSGLAPE